MLRRILPGGRPRPDNDHPAAGPYRDTAEDVSQSIERTVPVFGLLGAQLGHITETTETAAFALLDNMQAADGAAGDPRRRGGSAGRADR